MKLAYPDPDYREQVIRHWQETVDHPDATEPGEYRVTCRDGSIRNMVIAGSHMGEGLVVCFIDLTERRIAEAALLESEKRFRVLFETASDSIRVLDGDRVVDCNQRALDLFGYTTKDEIIGHSVLESCPEYQPDGSLSQERVTDLLSKARDGGALRFYWRHVRKDGTAFDSEISLNSFTYKGKLYAQAIGRDITDRLRAEETMRISENRFRNLFLRSPVPMIQVSFTGETLAVNENLTRVLGYEKQDIPDLDTWSANVYPDPEYREWVLKTWSAQVENALATGSDIPTMEYIVTDKYGSQHNMMIGATVLSDSFLASLADVTAHRTAESMTRLIHYSLDKARDGIVWLRSDARIYHVNQAVCRTLGYTREELIGKTVHDIDPDFPPEAWLPHLEELGRLGSITFESRHLAKDGTVIPVEINGNYIEFENQRGSFAIVHYIADRKAAEAALVKREEQYRALAENSLDSIMRFDRELRNIYANKRAEIHLGMTVDVILGKTLRELELPGDLCTMCENALKKVFDTGVVQRLEFQLPRGFWIDWLCAPETGKDGTILGVVTTARDITDYKQAEKDREKLHEQLTQAQKMESIGRLAGGVAHDFNNMLGVIIGYTELALQGKEFNATLRNHMGEIRKAAECSADLTKQLLAFARKQTVKPRVLNLNETVSGMLKMLQRLIGEDIELIWFPAKSLPPVMVDPSQIDQLLANLCVNARDAISDTGKVTIETAFVNFDQTYCDDHPDYLPGDYIMLAVSDTGCGMGSETLGRLFEPFFTTKEMGKGTGLGLATVYGIVKQNNGFVNVYSEKGIGTTFRIYLPKHIGVSHEPEIHETNSKAIKGKETVLLVEDGPAFLHMTTIMLQYQGYKVFTAATPLEALRLSETIPEPIDLLITDVVMPGMNGRELAHRLEKAYPAMKCLYMSGYTANVIAHHGVLDEGVNFIQKPFGIADLSIKVREAIDKS